MEQKLQIKPRPHTVSIDGRASARISGITEVISYDDNSVVACCDLGEIEISGTGIKIKSFDVSDGLMCIDGSIDSVRYLAGSAKKSGFFERIFK